MGYKTRLEEFTVKREREFEKPRQVLGIDC